MAGKGNHHGPGVVYRVTNVRNGKFYIGVTARSLRLRLSEHISTALTGRCNGAFQKAIRKYGAESFVIEPIHLCKTLGSAKAEEIRIISELRPQYNSTMGGDGQLGRSLSPSARRKIGEASKGRKARLGIPHSHGTRKRLSEIGSDPMNLARFASYSTLGPKALAKKVIRLDTGEIFDSASAAARSCGACKSTVIEVCLGKPFRIRAAGIMFRYVME